MADVFSKKKRSEIMSKIKSEGTSAEITVFRFLRREGVYFQKHYKKIKGSPDIALPRKKIAVFIDGDFWHGWNFNKSKERLPEKYWRSKIESNILRNKRQRREMKRKGWKILRVWEHELKKRKNKTLLRIKLFLLSQPEHRK